MVLSAGKKISSGDFAVEGGPRLAFVWTTSRFWVRRDEMAWTARYGARGPRDWAGYQIHNATSRRYSIRRPTGCGPVGRGNSTARFRRYSSSPAQNRTARAPMRASFSSERACTRYFRPAGSTGTSSRSSFHMRARMSPSHSSRLRRFRSMVHTAALPCSAARARTSPFGSTISVG